MPARTGEILFSGDVPDYLGRLGMRLAVVFDRHTVFRIGEIRLTYDAGT